MWLLFYFIQIQLHCPSSASRLWFLPS
jgi:hypothetical protein